jgi:ABC-type sulfate/molybdate transport systems ATPase subunit
VSAPLLQVENLTLALGGRPVLHQVSLELREGEVTALVGPNGAGKSTLLAAMTGLIRGEAGAVTLHGSIATAMQAPGLARRSAQANVELALAWAGVAPPHRRARATAALEALQAGPLAQRRATSLSGGEQRRVHLARALAIDPDILLLDEPFAGLDLQTRATLIEDTTSLVRGRRGTTLVVAHDRAEAWALGDRIVVLIDGRIAADAPRDALLAAPPTAEVARFLGYDGELLRGGQLLLTRPSHVRVGEGDDEATIIRIVPTEDGCRVRLQTADGTLHATMPGALPRIGDHVRFSLVGGVVYPR